MQAADLEAIKKLEKIYQKRIDTMRKEGVTVTEIVVYQINEITGGVPPSGEFDPDCIDSKSYDVKAAEVETETDVVVRMARHIHQLSVLAEKVHVKEAYLNPQNYISAEDLSKLSMAKAGEIYGLAASKKNIEAQKEKILATMQPAAVPDLKKVNHITRLSMSEFSLYPNVKRGPLTIAGFNRLVKIIDTHVGFLPENIHLLLASIPVKTKGNEVQNIVLYVQCGKQPVINAFTKLYISTVDPTYPNTINPQFTSNILTQAQKVNIQREGQKIVSKLIDSVEFTTLTKQELAEYKKICMDAKHVQPNQKLIDILTAIENNITARVNIDRVDGYVVAKKDAQELSDQINIFLTEAAKKHCYVEASLVSGALSDDVDQSLGQAMSVQYSGQIECRTLGGTQFRTGVEVCLDHAYGVIKKMLGDSITASRVSGETILPSLMSHIVTSNTIHIEEKMLVGKSLTHVDPVDSLEGLSLRDGMQVSNISKSTFEMANPIFGAHIYLNIFLPRALAPQNQEFEQQVRFHNRLAVHLNALRHYRNQHPEKVAMIHAEIIKHIIGHLRAEMTLLINAIQSVASKDMVARKIEGEFYKITLSHGMIDPKVNLIDVLTIMGDISKELKLNNATVYKQVDKSITAAKGMLEREDHDAKLIQNSYQLMHSHKERKDEKKNEKKMIKSGFFTTSITDVSKVVLLLEKLSNKPLSESEKMNLNLLMNSTIYKFFILQIKKILVANKSRNDVNTSKMGRIIFFTIEEVRDAQCDEISFQNDLAIKLKELKGYLSRIVGNTATEQAMKVLLEELKPLMVKFSAIKNTNKLAPSVVDSIYDKQLSELLIASNHLNELQFKKLEKEFNVIKAPIDKAPDEMIKAAENAYSLYSQRLINSLDIKKQPAANDARYQFKL